MALSIAWVVHVNNEYIARYKNMWLVKYTYLYHHCIPNGKCKILTRLVIGRIFMEKLRQDADFMPKDIQNNIKDQ